MRLDYANSGNDLQRAWRKSRMWRAVAIIFAVCFSISLFWSMSSTIEYWQSMRFGQPSSYFMQILHGQRIAPAR